MIYLYSMAQVTPGKGNMAKYHQMAHQLIPVIERCGGKLIGAWQTTMGEWGQVLLIEAYENLTQFEKARAEMAKDPLWQKLIPEYEGIRTVKLELMQATSYSPLQ